MKKNLSLIFAGIAWFAVITQFYLMMDNRVTEVPETVIRFFSFFTIQTNILTAVYFTFQFFYAKRNHWLNEAGSLTAITVYIIVVGMVYQLVLRQVWEPTGMQKLVDELLHSVNPILVLIFWFLYEKKSLLIWSMIPVWLIYPLIYLIYILFLGTISNFYPYPFVNVPELGYRQVFLNAFFMLLLFLGLSAVFVGVRKITVRNT